MPLHLKEFQKAEFQGYVESIPPLRTYILQGFLPDKPINDINFSYNVVDGKYTKAAQITGFNAAAPLRDKKTMAKEFGSIAKVQHGTKLDEEELLRFNSPRLGSDEQDQVIEYIYGTTEELVEGVRDVGEYLRAQALYNGSLNYIDEENDVNISVEFGIPSENKMVTELSWSDPASEPLKDISAAIKQYQSQNKRQKPSVWHMSSETEATLLQNDSIRTQIWGGVNTERMVTLDQIRALFTSLGFPPYQINDDVVMVWDEEEALLPDGKIVFLGNDLGNTYIGPTVENSYRPGMYTVTEIQESNPPYQAIYVGMTMFPAIKRPKSIVHLETEL